MALTDAAQRAAKAITALPRGSRWFIDCDTDADGVCGAAVISAALGRAGYAFQVRASREKTADAYTNLARQECAGFILIDKGTSHATQLAQIATERPVIIVDHHNVPEGDIGNVVLVNPRLEGMDGSRDASAATTAVAVALALGENADLAPVGLAGATGDWQHHGGWQGYNQELVEQGLEAGTLTRQTMPALVGATLAEAIARRSEIPNPEQWLAAIDIPAHVEAEELDLEQRTRLLSAWTRWDLANGIEQERVYELLWSTKYDMGVRNLFRVVDACGRQGRADVALAFLMGSKSAKEEAQQLFVEYKKNLAGALQLVTENPPDSLQALHWTTTEKPELTGMVAGIAVVHLVNQAMPLVVRADRGDAWQVSTRGTHEQVEAGMDLGVAIGKAAQSVECEGGGHPIASGAVIPHEKWDSFLSALDEELKQQGFLETS